MGSYLTDNHNLEVTDFNSRGQFDPTGKPSLTTFLQCQTGIEPYLSFADSKPDTRLSSDHLVSQHKISKPIIKNQHDDNWPSDSQRGRSPNLRIAHIKNSCSESAESQEKKSSCLIDDCFEDSGCSGIEMSLPEMPSTIQKEANSRSQKNKRANKQQRLGKEASECSFVCKGMNAISDDEDIKFSFEDASDEKAGNNAQPTLENVDSLGSLSFIGSCKVRLERRGSPTRQATRLPRATTAEPKHEARTSPNRCKEYVKDFYSLLLNNSTYKRSASTNEERRLRKKRSW